MTVELPSDVVPLWDAVTRGLQLEQVDVLAQLGLGEEEAEGALEPLQVRGVGWWSRGVGCGRL
jgi:hypothetical protein